MTTNTGREREIVYQVGALWVSDSHGQYTVYRDGVIVARADSSYPRTADGLSIARARVDYLTRRDARS